MFETLSIAESRPIAILKKSFLIIIIALLGIGAVSSYRAYVQVRSLELDAGSEVREGTEITASVVTSGKNNCRCGCRTGAGFTFRNALRNARSRE
jgi:hypothetical protein